MGKLKIQFESDQEHQVRAIESSIKLFSGYTKRETPFQLGDDTIANMDEYEMLDEEWLFDNLLEVQQENVLVEDMFLNFEDGFEMVGIDSWRHPYYTCEMESTKSVMLPLLMRPSGFEADTSKDSKRDHVSLMSLYWI